MNQVDITLRIDEDLSKRTFLWLRNGSPLLKLLFAEDFKGVQLLSRQITQMQRETLMSLLALSFVPLHKDMLQVSLCHYASKNLNSLSGLFHAPKARGFRPHPLILNELEERWRCHRASNSSFFEPGRGFSRE